MPYLVFAFFFLSATLPKVHLATFPTMAAKKIISLLMVSLVMALFIDSSDACRFHRPSRKCMDVKMRRRGSIRGVNLGRCRKRGGHCRMSDNRCHCDVSNRILK